MPSPGGGSRGGGFRGGSRGGGFGGSSGGGGFRGGHTPRGFHTPHHHHHHHHRPFYGFYRPYRVYGYGGAYHGGIISTLFVPIITLIFVIIMLFNLASSMFFCNANRWDNEYAYNEEVLQNYALNQYAREFYDSRAYEDNILIVFLVNEDRDLYDTLAIVGDNIADPIYNMFGNQYSEYGSEMQSNIASYYENTLSRNMAGAISGMQRRITNLNLSSNFVSPSKTPSGSLPHFTNNTSIQINTTIINSALESFTNSTNIPIAIVFEDFADVYGSDSGGLSLSFSLDDVIIVLVIFLFGTVSIYLIVVNVKDYKASKNRSNTENDEEKIKKQSSANSEEEKKNNSTHW